MYEIVGKTYENDFHKQYSHAATWCSPNRVAANMSRLDNTISIEEDLVHYFFIFFPRLTVCMQYMKRMKVAYILFNNPEDVMTAKAYARQTM